MRPMMSNDMPVLKMSNQMEKLKLSFKVVSLEYPKNFSSGSKMKKLEQLIKLQNDGLDAWPDDTRLVLNEVNTDLKFPKKIVIGSVP